eukprot:TRINITY_DN3939_c0_g1_i1.p1 TRINITY_DN3939_c0_g1~~TRINITY_DN3939_c0_g1_i1.p1  ORF type:complete len:301 (+),score=22.64 TRINITY_DN3939_c0_g1_i1:184-1086(+)
MCIRDRYQRRVHGRTKQYILKDSSAWIASRDRVLGRSKNAVYRPNFFGTHTPEPLVSHRVENYHNVEKYIHTLIDSTENKKRSNNDIKDLFSNRKLSYAQSPALQVQPTPGRNHYRKQDLNIQQVKGRAFQTYYTTARNKSNKNKRLTINSRHKSENLLHISAPHIKWHICFIESSDIPNCQGVRCESAWCTKYSQKSLGKFKSDKEKGKPFKSPICSTKTSEVCSQASGMSISSKFRVQNLEFPSNQIVVQSQSIQRDKHSLSIFELSLIHISEPTRPLYISYAVFCLKKKKKKNINLI